MAALSTCAIARRALPPSRVRFQSHFGRHLAKSRRGSGPRTTLIVRSGSGARGRTSAVHPIPRSLRAHSWHGLACQISMPLTFPLGRLDAVAGRPQWARCGRSFAGTGTAGLGCPTATSRHSFMGTANGNHRPQAAVARPQLLQPGTDRGCVTTSNCNGRGESISTAARGLRANLGFSVIENLTSPCVALVGDRFPLSKIARRVLA
jgi:hypothetical protein